MLLLGEVVGVFAGAADFPGEFEGDADAAGPLPLTVGVTGRSAAVVVGAAAPGAESGVVGLSGVDVIGTASDATNGTDQ